MMSHERQPSSDVTSASGRVSRRAALTMLLSAGAAGLLAACQPAAPSAPPTTAPAAAPKPAATTAPAAPAAAPTATSVVAPAAAAPTAATGIKKGGTLRWGQVTDPVSLDPVLWSPTSNQTTGLVTESLIEYDYNLNPLPSLAESWEQSNDLSQIKLNLRKGVTWHSGRAFTSDDVEFSLLHARDPKNAFAAVVAPGSAWWTSWEKPDANTIILKSDKPRPGVFDFLQYLRILDHESLDGVDTITRVVGTGPFMWKEWVQGDHITFVKNPNYWDSGKPYLDGVQMSIFRDAQSMVTALETGALDVADLIPVPDADRLRNDPKYRLYEIHDVGQFFYAAMNAAKPPTDNKLLRQAILYSIDRQAFVDTIMKGFPGEQRDLPWARTSPAFDAQKNKTYAYDLDKAKSLLQQSGLTNVTFDIAWATAGYQAEYQALASIIQASLAKIGVTTNLKPLDPPVFTQQGIGNQPTYTGMRLSAGAFAQLYEASSEFTLSRTYGYASNGSSYYDDKYTQLVASAATEPDAAKRKDLYGQINDYLLDAAYATAISPYTDLELMQPNVQGLRMSIATAVKIGEVWLS